MATRKLPYVVSRRRKDGSLAYRGFAITAAGRRLFSETFDSENDAYNAALAMRGEAKNRTASEDLDTAIDKVLTEAREKRTKGSVRWYADHLRAVCRLIPGETLLCDITAETIEQYIRDRLAPPAEGGRRCKPATVNADLRALHRVFAVAIRRGIVKDNPVRRVERPRADTPAIDWFTEEELRAILGKITNERARDVVLLLASTGIRRSEAARLQPGHVRMKLRQLVVPGKTRTRVVPLAPDLDAPLTRLLAAASKTELLPGGTHALDDLFRDIKDEVDDRRLHAHALRHTFCTTLIRQGVRPDIVMRLADHRDIKTTMRYVHEVGGEAEDAVRLLRFVRPSESAAPAQQ